MDVRLADWKRPDGIVAKVVYSDWRNAGPVPVRKVTATVRVLAPGGQVVRE